MKKIWLMMITIFILLCGSATAEMVFDAEYYEKGTETVLPETNPPGLIEVNGVKYIDTGSTYRATIPYIGNEDMLESYQNEMSKTNSLGYEYQWTGEYYLVRPTGGDNRNVPSNMFAEHIYGGKPVYFYDKYFNLVTSARFTGYVRNISYVDGTYYCALKYPTGYTYRESTDLVNWDKTTGPIPEKIGNVHCRLANMNYQDTAFSLDGKNYYPLAEETEQPNGGGFRFGEWEFTVKKDAVYITNDGIYNIKIPIGEDLEVYEPYTNTAYAFDLQQIYEVGENLVIDLRNFRLTTPKQPVYDALNAMKNAPYVRVGDELLSFETPPVTEEDRTLVPMRFLFEQLGAEVSWDEATETATAVKANTTINFAIDNATATINGAETAMEVPARLVGDKTMVPLRFLSEQMGYTVEWDEETRLATITMPLTEKVAMQDTNQFETWIQ